MAETRIVPDTNVLVSALLWTGKPHELLRLAEAGEFILVTTPAILEELRDVLGRPKFASRIVILQTTVAEIIESLLSLVEIVPDIKIEPVVERDPDDDKVIACAVAAQAKWLVSGDDDLLVLKQYKNIPILTPSRFLRIWKKSQ